MASAPSVSIPPKATTRASLSRPSCLADVPLETTAWKPETAPHATVMNSSGQIGPCGLLALMNAGPEMVGCITSSEMNPPSRPATSRYIDR